MSTKITTIRLEEEQLSSVKELGINLSEWVRTRLQEDILNSEEIDKRIENTQKELEMLKNMKKSVIQCNTIEYNEIQFLQESKQILANSPEFLEGRINLYCNTFGKKNKPTRKQFLEMLDKI